MSLTSAAEDARPADPAPKRSFVRRVGEWLWCGGAVAAARAREHEQAHARRYAHRARIAAEVADRTLDPSAPWSAGSAAHVAAGLYLESIGWSLRLAAYAGGAEPAPPDRAELADLVSRQRDLLGAVEADDQVVTRVVDRALGHRGDVYSSSGAESELAARELGRIAHALLRESGVRADALDQLYFKRLWRTGSCALALLALVAGGNALWDAHQRKNDLARGKPWSTSSSYEAVCPSPQHDCEAKKSYFFHTQEEPEPWFEIDLQREEAFSAVQVFNRQDCCGERSVPLVIEVSGDRRKWREVARRQAPFEVWKADFSAVEGRYLRLRVARRSILHLEDVRVLR